MVPSRVNVIVLLCVKSKATVFPKGAELRFVTPDPTATFAVGGASVLKWFSSSADSTTASM